MHGQKVYYVPKSRSSPKLTRAYRNDNNGVIIECDEPQHAVTPGQVAVLWENDWCLGSGAIATAF